MRAPFPACRRRSTLGLLVAGAVLLAAASAGADERPNVVLILTDNHGAWTLGCYGNPDIRTPHIDALAADGVRFTQAFASNPVCSPTRASLLTGLLPSQHGVHCFLRGGRLQVGPEARNTLDRFVSLPEILKQHGYRCGLVGKWHLGGNLQPQEGLDDYWITMPHGGTSTFYDANIIEDGAIRQEPQYLTDFWTDHAVRFLEGSAEDEQPFFLMLAYNGPYALGRLLLREGQNRHADYYADHPLPSFPREPAHAWQYNNLDYLNQDVSIRRVATEVSGIDDGVGRVRETLRRLSLDENTIVIFLADQGWVGGHGGFFGMGDHTRPVTAADGMMQIPMIWTHSGRIPAGIECDRLVANYDVLPTLLAYLDMEMPPQTGDTESGTAMPESPGRDFSAALAGEDLADWDDVVYYEFEGLRCIRTSGWKYVHRFPEGPHELYHLRDDPDEQSNLIDSKADATRVERMRKRLFAFFDEVADPEFDLWRGGTSQTALFQPIAVMQEPHSDSGTAAAHAIEPDSDDPEFQPVEFQVPDGYEVSLAAAPPLVQHPMMGSFDDRGRLYVAESAGFNLRNDALEQERPNSIRMLEDTDGDGRFDRATVFADQMTFPQGALWHEGALYVASPPYIWRLEDTDDDGVADRRDRLVGEFGYTGNAASIHGCFLGPDGRIYWCDGRHGHEFRDETGRVISQRRGSYIFSCRPDGSDVQIHAGGGMDNPVEVDFSPAGDVLGTVNIMYRSPRIDCLVHWQYGGTYPHHESVLGEMIHTGELLGPVHRFGHVAVSGMTRYRSGALDRRFRDDLFVTIFNLGKVVRVELERSGSTFRAAEREFLVSDNRDFHPTDVLEDADGSLLVIDTGGWFLNGCPTSQVARPQVRGAIYRVRRSGMATIPDPRGEQIPWSELESGRLVRLLNDTRYAVRERAIRELARRGGPAVPSLVHALQFTGQDDRRVPRGDLRTRRGAVWALTRIANPAAIEGLTGALHDHDPVVRQAACHGLAVNADRVIGSGSPSLTETVHHTLREVLQQDDSASVRRVAARAIGCLGDRQQVGALFDALPRAADREEEHALTFALIQLNDPAATRAHGFASSDPAVLRAALVALDQMESGGLVERQVVPFLLHENKRLRTTAQGIVSQHPDWAERVRAVLDRQLSGGSLTAARSEELRRLAAAFLDQGAVADLAAVQLDPAGSIEQAEFWFEAIAAAGSVPLHPAWIEPFNGWLDRRSAAELEHVLPALAAIRSPEFSDRLQQLAANPDLPVGVRLLALEAQPARTRVADSSFTMLVELLQEGEHPLQATRAARLLANRSLNDEQLVELAPALKELGPIELRELIRAYANCRDEDPARALLAALEETHHFASLPSTEFSDVVKRFPDPLLPRANRLLDQLRRRDQEQVARLEAVDQRLPQGDIARGAALYRSERARCVDCHRINGEGSVIGPDLSRIGQIRSRRDLLEAILFPSSSLAREYEPFVAELVDGRVLSGLILEEHSDAITLQPPLGEPVLLQRSQIERLVPGTVSIMPQGLEGQLSDQDLADLLAFLQSLR